MTDADAAILFSFFQVDFACLLATKVGVILSIILFRNYFYLNETAQTKINIDFHKHFKSSNKRKMNRISTRN